MHKEFKVTKAKVYPLGVSVCEEGMHIAAVCDRASGDRSDEFGVILYDRKHKDGVRIPFPEEGRVGAVHAMLLKGYHDRESSYLFYCGDSIWQDPYCKKIVNSGRYGVKKKELPRCAVCEKTYDWGDDRPLCHPYEDMILYALHVRGFTKHKTSGVQYRGTYLGLTEKTTYLKELGITSILLMPAYEFDEVMEISAPMSMEQAAASYAQMTIHSDGPVNSDGSRQAYRLNFWGYQKGLYYVPKSAYAYDRDAVTEFKDMVKKLHKNGLEVLMQFYFPPEFGSVEMIEVLKYWVLEYHIDGFHIMGVDLPIEMFAREPLLSDTKILTIQQYSPRADDYMAQTRKLSWLSDGFLYDVRKAVKGDDNMINQLLFHIRNNRPETGIVNYIAKWEGMRLIDMVTYDRKHNEANGEDNQDGTDYNCSWNCGVEGKSRRKNIIGLRLKQMKNALSLVILSQGTPLIYSGDEFGNTQDGNNNPYCQDNAVAWIKWNRTESGNALFQYTKMLIKLRKAHPILHSSMPLKGMDYLSCGYPDISYHGRDAWRPDTGPASRSVGVMFCGYYGNVNGHKDDTFIYIGINLHWSAYYFGLPQLPKGKEWRLLTSTDPGETGDVDTKQTEGETEETLQEIYVGPRTIVIYEAKDAASKAEKTDRGRKKA